MRQKKVLQGTLDKYIEFLNVVKEKQFSGQSLKFLVQSYSINKTIIKAMIELNVIELKNDNLWRYKDDANPGKQEALEILNYLLELNKKQIVTPITGLDDETKGYIKAIHDHLVSNSQNKLGGLDGLKTPMLSKALNQMEPNQSNHLFTQVESNEAKRFELLKAIASGVYSKVEFCNHEFVTVQDGYSNSSSGLAYKTVCAKCRQEPNPNAINSFDNTNNSIIEATEDLFNKFFKVKS